MQKVYKKLDSAIKILHELNLECNDELSKIFDREDMDHICAGLDWLCDTAKNYEDYLIGQRDVLKNTVESN